MPSVSSSIDIDASIESLWDLVSDPPRYPEWVASTDRMIEVPKDGLRQGATYKEYAGFPPFKSESEWRVTVFEPHRRQVHLGDDGTVQMELTIELEPTDGGSRLTQTLDIRPRGMLTVLMVVMWPLVMRRRAQRAMHQTVADAKRLVESGSV
jgi:uncharacterized protein YndB with AHSA1/START domain